MGYGVLGEIGENLLDRLLSAANAQVRFMKESMSRRGLSEVNGAARAEIVETYLRALTRAATQGSIALKDAAEGADVSLDALMAAFGAYLDKAAGTLEASALEYATIPEHRFSVVGLFRQIRSFLLAEASREFAGSAAPH